MNTNEPVHLTQLAVENRLHCGIFLRDAARHVSTDADSGLLMLECVTLNGARKLLEFAPCELRLNGEDE
jgi:hypothetical protein